MRGNPRTLDWRKPSEELGYEVISMDRYREIGPDATTAIIGERIGDAPLYITFDLDCLDPTVAPAVANLEAVCEGFKIDEVMQLLRCVRGKERHRRRRRVPDAHQGPPEPDHRTHGRCDHVRNRQPRRDRFRR